MKVPEISIIMSVYNTEKYIKDAIDSTLNQTFKDFEFIIINDGSTDNTVGIINSYTDPRIKLIDSKHDFINSLNIGISAAKGKYIARMDADDIMTPERLQIQYDFMEANPLIDICGGGMTTFGNDYRITQPVESHEEIILFVLKGNPIANPTVMMKTSLRKLFSSINNTYEMYSKEYAYAEDYNLWVDLIIKGCRLVNIPQIILKYRVSESQVTSIYRTEMANSTFRIQGKYMEFLMEKIIEIDESFYNIFEESINLFNKSKISLILLMHITHSIAGRLKTKLSLHISKKTNQELIKKKILLFTIAVGDDPVYFNSVQRYLSYNKTNFGQNYNVDYLLFTDRGETIEGMICIPCQSLVWPYAALLKNNILSDYLDKNEKWGEYEYIYFIDADFAIGEKYNFFDYEFFFVKPNWNSKIAGGFYGGRTKCFEELCRLFYIEKKYIYENKLSLPRNLDEFYLSLFYEQYKEKIHLVEMTSQNTLIFYDNENLEKKIEQRGTHLFMQPYKSAGRANKVLITRLSTNTIMECIVNIKEEYIFDNYTYDFGRLIKIDNRNYRILWCKNPDIREMINIENNEISVSQSSL